MLQPSGAASKAPKTLSGRLRCSADNEILLQKGYKAKILLFFPFFLLQTPLAQRKIKQVQKWHWGYRRKSETTTKTGRFWRTWRLRWAVDAGVKIEFFLPFLLHGGLKDYGKEKSEEEG